MLKTRNLIVATLIAIGASQAVMAQSTAAPVGHTRAEVLADLQIYRESGLLALRQVETYDFNSPLVRSAQARYAALRSSPRYAALVQSIAASRGEKVSVAGQ